MGLLSFKVPVGVEALLKTNLRIQFLTPLPWMNYEDSIFNHTSEHLSQQHSFDLEQKLSYEISAYLTIACIFFFASVENILGLIKLCNLHFCGLFEFEYKFE